MRSLFSLIFLIFLATIPALAAEELFEPKETCRCRPDQKDPFEHPIAYAQGAKAGLCVDTCRFRRTQILRSGHKIEIANVEHDHGFRIALINPEAAYAVDVLFEQFLPKINHVALRVHFHPDSPVLLRSQSEKRSEFLEQTHDLIISVESALPRGQDFEIFNATNGDYLLDYRLTTLEAARSWMVQKKHHWVRQFQLNLEPRIIPNLVRLALRLSQERSFANRYYLFTANCASSAFDMLDQASGVIRPAGARWTQRALSVDGPFGTLNYLYSNGLIAKEMPTLEQEYLQPTR